MAWSDLACSIIALSCISLLFQATGYAIPLWMVVHNKVTNISVHLGLWYVMTCDYKVPSSCISKSIGFDFVFNDKSFGFNGTEIKGVLKEVSEGLGGDVYWLVVSVLASVALVMTSFAVLIIVCCRCAGLHSRPWFISGLVCLLLGSVVGLAATILYAVAFTTIFLFSVNVEDAATFPWSVLIFGVGSFIGIVTTILLLVLICKWKQYGKYFASEDIPMEKMPHTSRDNNSYEQGCQPGPSPSMRTDTVREHRSLDARGRGFVSEHETHPRGQDNEDNFNRTDYDKNREWRDNDGNFGNQDYKTNPRERDYDFSHGRGGPKERADGINTRFRGQEADDGEHGYQFYTGKQGHETTYREPGHQIYREVLDGQENDAFSSRWENDEYPEFQGDFPSGGRSENKENEMNYNRQLGGTTYHRF